MQQAANAYARASQAALSPRELEAAVLIKAATRLQAISDDWDGRRPELGEALGFNQKLWTILVAEVTREDSPVPHDIKQNILNLGMFTFNRTLSLLAEPQAAKLAALVNINREIAAGLRATPQAQSQAA